MNTVNARTSRFALSIAILLTAWAQTASAQIEWRSGAAARSGRMQADIVNTIVGAGSGGERSHIVVQFAEPLTPSRRAKCAAAGVVLQTYLGNNAFFASVSPNVDPVAMGRVASLVDAQSILPQWKLHAVLNRGETPTWAVVPVPQNKADELGAKARTWIGAYVLCHADVALEDARDIVESRGAVVRRLLHSVNGMVIELPTDSMRLLAGLDILQYIEPALPLMNGVNNSNRAITQADVVQAAPYNLDGSGVNVMVYDGGYARASHMDFGGRLTVRDNSGISNHATHVSGTIGGAGTVNPAYKGMAPGVTIQSYGFEQVGGLQPGFLYTDPGDLEADYNQAINVYGADISNNSIGTNTAPNGFPCVWEGDYGVTASLIDAIVGGSLGQPFRVVWANGNERASGRCGTTYHTTAPPACAKNHITVGALNSNDDSVSWFTSWGPTDDDRLKPDISAPGCQVGGDGGVTSCSSASDSSYTTMCGTSMASPTVCGLSALLLQDFRVQFPGQPDFRNSTLKALLAHNAQDIEAIGPDYKTGYGSVRIQATVDFLRTGAFEESSVSQGASEIRSIAVGAGDLELKVTLAWDDVPGTPNVLPALVNDLDLRVFSPSGIRHYPWTLGGLANPASPAVRTVEDHINNIEQVLVDNPEPGLWTVEVLGFNIPAGMQVFSLVGSGAANVGTSISFPNPLPTAMSPGVAEVIDVRILSVGEGLVPGSETFYYRYDAGAFLSIPLTLVAGDLYQATLPAPGCGELPEFYFSAEGATTGVVYQPVGAPATTFSAPVGAFFTTFADSFEGDSGWLAENLGATSGDWQRGVPIDDPTWAYDPIADADGSGYCFLTQNTTGNSDVDGGAVRLTSPAIDMTAPGGIRILYDYYLYLTNTTGGVDSLLVEIDGNDGAGPWTEIARHDTSGGLSWRTGAIGQADLDAAGVTLTTTTRIRFTANDGVPDSINESGLDAVCVQSFQCGSIVGACCSQYGVCTIREAANCTASGGTYHGDGTTCTPGLCPRPTGSCCLANGSCLTATVVSCQGVSGTYGGHDTTCTPNPCPQPTGACCDINGVCTSQTAAGCAAAGGTYVGDGIACFPNPCPVPVGACCDAVGSCGVQPASECLAEGGTFQGNGTVCTPTPCPQLSGACCQIDGSCITETQVGCSATGGEYIGDNTDCATATCEQPQSACCAADGSCSDVTQAECAASGGTYFGFDVTCGMNPCPPPPTACCLADGSCVDLVDAAACAALGGTFPGAGKDCAATTCSVLPGACCYSDGSCTDEPDAAACTALGGTFRGHGINCLAVSCELPGDVDCNGSLDINDSQALVDVLLGTDSTPCHVAAADINGDIVVDGGDIQMFVNLLVGP